MTGAEHYRAAERALEHANGAHLGDEANFHLAAAQVHATLALAASTALDPENYPGSARHREWCDAVEPTAVTS